MSDDRLKLQAIKAITEGRPVIYGVIFTRPVECSNTPEIFESAFKATKKHPALWTGTAEGGS